MFALILYASLNGMAVTSPVQSIPSQFQTRAECDRVASAYARKLARRGMDVGWSCVEGNEPALPLRHKICTSKAFGCIPRD